MSTNINTYVMRGTILPYDEFKGDGIYEELEPYMDSAMDGESKHYKGLCVLFDGMNGEYVAIGRVLAKTANHQAFDKPIKLDDNYETDELLAVLIEQLVKHSVDLETFVISHCR